MRRAAALVVLASLVLAGCSFASPTPHPEPDATAGVPAGQGSQEPGGDAELAAFRAALAGHTPADPDALVAAVVAAGFDRSAIERTREVDSLGAPVTFLEIAVRTDSDCLVGQVGDGEPMALRAPLLGGERCLVGDVVGLD